MKYTATFYFPTVKNGTYKSVRNIDIPKINEFIDDIVHDKSNIPCILKVYEGKNAPYDDTFMGNESDKLVEKYVRYNQSYYTKYSNQINFYLKSINPHCL